MHLHCFECKPLMATKEHEWSKGSLHYPSREVVGMMDCVSYMVSLSLELAHNGLSRISPSTAPL